MKDFDLIRLEKVNSDRTIKIGGEEFTFKAAVAAEDWAAWIDGGSTTQAEYLVEMDTFVLAALEPGQEDKWRAVRDPSADFPLSKDDIQEVIVHIVEVVVGRPIVRQSASPGGGSAAGTSSTVQPQPEGETLTV